MTSDWESVSFTVDRNSEEFRVAKYAQKMRQGSPLRLAKHQDYLEEICTKVGKIGGDVKIGRFYLGGGLLGGGAYEH